MKMVIESAEEIFDLDLDTIGYFLGELVARDLAETKNELLQLKERKLDVVNMW